MKNKNKMKTSKNMRVCCLLALCSVCFCGCSFAQKTVVSKSVVCVSDYDANISSTELDKVWNSGYKYIFSMPDSARLVTYQTLQKLLATPAYTPGNTLVLCSDQTYELTKDACNGNATVSKALGSSLSPKGMKIKEYKVEKPSSKEYDYKFSLTTEH